MAQAGPRLDAQQAFVRGPFILVDPTRSSPASLTRRAYAVVANAPEAGLAVDAYFTHRRLAEAAAARRGPPSAVCGADEGSTRSKRVRAALRGVSSASAQLRCAAAVSNSCEHCCAGWSPLSSKLTHKVSNPVSPAMLGLWVSSAVDQRRTPSCPAP